MVVAGNAHVPGDVLVFDGRLEDHALRKLLDHAALKAAGLARGGKDGVRLLAKGEYSAKLSFTVAGVSSSAREAVEKAGGSVTVPELVPAADKAKAKHRTAQAARKQA